MKIIKNKNKSRILNGGRFLGEGSFGCVVSPAIECGKTRKSTKKNKQTKHNDISKIIIIPDEQVENEIEVSKILKKIDSNQKYFIHIQDNCKVKTVPKERSNLASVKFMNNEFSTTRMLEKKKLDKKYCDIDLTRKPINLIMSNAGSELNKVLDILIKKTNSSTDKNIFKLGTTMFRDFKYCFRNLLEGLYKLHQNRIVNRDIKKENIMVDWNENKDQVNVRYIDFGLSEILTPKHCNDFRNIHMWGTYELLSPEIFVVGNFKYYKNYSREYILQRITKDIKKYVGQMFYDLRLNFDNINEIITNLFNDTEARYKNKTLLDKYFGTPEDKFNGYLQKADVYALGISFYEILTFFTDKINLKKDIKLHNLLKNMMELNPDKRFNIIQCLQHPYFS
jgi:serine/threonine protein kinase